MNNNNLKNYTSQHDWFSPFPSLHTCQVRERLKQKKLLHACLLDHNCSHEHRHNTHLLIFNQDVKVVKHTDNPLIPSFERTKRGRISGFSKPSKRRLTHVSRNSGWMIRSQIALTYHEKRPKNGIDVKRHLKLLIECIRREFPKFDYLWILEFQESGQPHYHIFSNIPHTTKRFHNFVATHWNRITEESKTHLMFHSHYRNFCKWDMGSGSYLVKSYLSKEKQKMVPDGFENVGRFWGSSRSMTPTSQICVGGYHVGFDTLIKAVRTMSKRMDAVYRGFGTKKRFAQRKRSYTLHLATSDFVTCLEYYGGFTPPLDEIPF